MTSPKVMLEVLLLTLGFVKGLLLRSSLKILEEDVGMTNLTNQ
jgi:hypothetical protein